MAESEQSFETILDLLAKQVNDLTDKIPTTGDVFAITECLVQFSLMYHDHLKIHREQIEHLDTCQERLLTMLERIVKASAAQLEGSQRRGSLA